QALGALQVLVCGQGPVLDREFGAGQPPDLVLGVGVGDLGHGSPRLPLHCEARDGVAPFAVFGVGESRVVLTQFHDDRAVCVGVDRREILSFFEHSASGSGLDRPVNAFADAAGAASAAYAKRSFAGVASGAVLRRNARRLSSKPWRSSKRSRAISASSIVR